MGRPFRQVDVFGHRSFTGNPVAVVLEAAGLTDEQMQRLARWTNLSETTFVLPADNPAADYRLRIFTPGGELPFAGHPTLGSAHAWLECGGTPATPGLIVQECAAGLVELRVLSGGGLAFAAPPTIKSGPLDAAELDTLCRAFGLAQSQVLAHQWVDNGPGWSVLRLESAADVLALRPNLDQIADRMVGVVGGYPAGSELQFELRAFAPRIGVAEDPVTGSLQASVAQWLVRTGEAQTGYLAGQGSCVGRDGRVQIEVDAAGGVWVSGATVSSIRGEIEI